MGFVEITEHSSAKRPRDWKSTDLDSVGELGNGDNKRKRSTRKISIAGFCQPKCETQCNDGFVEYAIECSMEYCANKFPNYLNMAAEAIKEHPYSNGTIIMLFLKNQKVVITQSYNIRYINDPFRRAIVTGSFSRPLGCPMCGCEETKMQYKFCTKKIYYETT